MRIDIEKLKHDVEGRWPSIISALSIEIPAPGKSGPCPVCGGKDRFVVKSGTKDGAWYCNTEQIGGDGWKLIMHVCGVDFIGACYKVLDVIGSASYDAPKEPDKEKIRAYMNDLWRSSKPLTGSDPVSKYLHSRRIVLEPKDTRYCERCWNSERKQDMVAMISLFRSSPGDPVAIQRTYLDGERKASLKSPKKTMKLNDMRGGAIRLAEPYDVIGIAEGMETAMACRHLFNVPTWATTSATLLEAFEPIEGIKKYVVFGDCDATFTGQSSAYKLAQKLYAKDLIVEVQIPTHGDWADILLGKN